LPWDSDKVKLGGAHKTLYSGGVHAYSVRRKMRLTDRPEADTMITTEQKRNTIQEFQLNEKDTGSADVQIALLTQRINELTVHLQANVKDHSSRRGLLMLVGQRRRLLDYLNQTDTKRYQKVIKKLNLRK
jgi:small subunit ribosomal protein S15